MVLYYDHLSRVAESYFLVCFLHSRAFLKSLRWLVDQTKISSSKLQSNTETGCVNAPLLKPFLLFQIILFEGSETSKRDFLLRDSLGRFMSRLIVRRIEHSHAGLYTCQPASAQPATVTVHVLNGTVLAVADGEFAIESNARSSYIVIIMLA